jgi:hypothetical protein
VPPDPGPAQLAVTRQGTILQEHRRVALRRHHLASLYQLQRGLDRFLGFYNGTGFSAATALEIEGLDRLRSLTRRSPDAAQRHSPFSTCAELGE